MNFLSNKLHGLALCFAIAVPAAYLGKLFPIIGAPVFAIILGLLMAGIPRSDIFQGGITFTSKKILQYAIILLGFGMNLFEIFRVGSQSLLIIISTIGTALVVSYAVSRIMKIDHDIATLVGVGSSICGGSAIAAAAPVIKASDEDIAQSISVIFLFNVIAAFLFPTLGAILGFNDMGFGMWAGTAINDTSSVVAAGQTWASASGSDTALNYATIVKLTRTLAIIPICLGLAYLTSKRKATTSEVKISLQTSLSHRELSHRTPLLQERKFVSLLWWRGFCGKVFLSDWEVRDFLQGAASRSICGGKYLRNAFNEPIGCEAAPSKKHLPPKAKTSPKSTRQSKAKQIIAMQGGCSWGKFFCCLGRHGFLAGCGYRTLFVGDTFRRYALHECRQAESWHSRKA